MARAMMSVIVGVGVLMIAASAGAQSGEAVSSPAFDELEKALPAGWTMLATGSELVFRHDRPCYVAAVHRGNPAPAPAPTSTTPPGVPNGPTANKPSAAPAGGGLVTFELRFRLEPRWGAAQLATAREANARVAGELRSLVATYHVDQIHHSKGKPLPANADERARLDAYDSAHARIAKRIVPVPKCAIGDVSLFDGEDTYAQLQLELDPPEVIPQAHKILALIKQRCR